MASIHREMHIEVSPEFAWDALRDVGALHTRLVPGFVTNTELVEGARIVTFGNGMVAREELVDVDEKTMRVAWSVTGSALMTHHNASAQVIPEGDGCRFVWIADLLPHSAAPQVAAMMDQGMAVIRTTLEAAAQGQ